MNEFQMWNEIDTQHKSATHIGTPYFVCRKSKESHKLFLRAVELVAQRKNAVGNKSLWSIYGLSRAYELRFGN